MVNQLKKGTKKNQYDKFFSRRVNTMQSTAESIVSNILLLLLDIKQKKNAYNFIQPNDDTYHDYSLQIWCRKNERKIRLFLDINTKIHTLASE